MTIPHELELEAGSPRTTDSSTEVSDLHPFLVNDPIQRRDDEEEAFAEEGRRRGGQYWQPREE